MEQPDPLTKYIGESEGVGEEDAVVVEDNDVEQLAHLERDVSMAAMTQEQ